MIDFDTLSDEEKRTIEELRKRVENELEPELREDATLCYRFLKARDFNIDKAEKMLRKHMIWRRAKQVSTILEDFVPKEVFVNYLEPSYIGTDKNGDLLLYTASGKMEGIDVLLSIKMNDYIDHWIWNCEKVFALLKELNDKRPTRGRKFSQISLIVDLDTLSFSNATSRAATEIFHTFLLIIQDNFPEKMSALYAINDGWREALLNACDADILPAFLGGNRKDPDGNPLCKTFVSHGGEIHSFYFLSDGERYFTDKSEVTTIFVPKSGRKEVYVDVEEEGSVIQWKFWVKDKDIGFGLFLENLGVNEILPVLRYSTPDGTAKGSYKTKLAGKYFILFDNSYSWLNSKEIQYTIQITKKKQ